MMKETISDGRYIYHLQDIAEIEAMSQPIDPIHKMQLDMMKTEVEEYEAAHPEKVVSTKLSEPIDILETACFPKGCMLNEEMQLILVTTFIPQLKDVGMVAAEWTRGATLLEEPHLTKVKGVVCQGCNVKKCLHNSNYSPIGEDDLLRVAFTIPYGERMDFDKKVLDQILPDDELLKLEKDGHEVCRWMSSSRNRLLIIVTIGDQSVRYEAKLRQKWTDFTVNDEERPVPTSIEAIRTIVEEITKNVHA